MVLTFDWLSVKFYLPLIASLLALRRNHYYTCVEFVQIWLKHWIHNTIFCWRNMQHANLYFCFLHIIVFRTCYLTYFIASYLKLRNVRRLSRFCLSLIYYITSYDMYEVYLLNKHYFKYKFLQKYRTFIHSRYSYTP